VHAAFVEDLDEVPPGQTPIYSGHGVSPAVRALAAERKLNVIEATCALVPNVHVEPRRFAADYDIVHVGNLGATTRWRAPWGKASERTRVVARRDEVPVAQVANPERFAY
jgi:4-hydroxy-3-methylbut-2-enyl diphosphate reductase